MQYEDFDKKIKDAADHHHPTYDEQAWGKMESLLDTHMPQEKEKKRRFLFFWLLFLLLGGTALLIAKPWSKGSVISEERVATSKEGPSTLKNGTLIQDNRIEPADDKLVQENNLFPKSQNEPLQQNSSINQEGITQTTPKNKTNRSNNLTGAENNTVSSLPEKKNQRKETTSSDGEIISPTTPKINNGQDQSIASIKNHVTTDPKTKATRNDKNTDSSLSTIDKKSNSQEAIVKGTELATEKEVKKEKKKPIKSNDFFFSLSAGPDASGAGGEKLGKTKLLAGFGLGYTFKDRLTIRTGFYSGRKIYAASPEEYNPPANFWTYYPYLEKVEADCKVYEIPLTVSYNFGRTSKQNWFAAAGLSSYLMKKEEYNYFYKYAPNTPTLNAKWTVNNENKHLFSVITLSGGYQRKLNNSVSMMVEPYIKFPLNGVGYGKVKLNSGGVLMTIAITPFQKR